MSLDFLRGFVTILGQISRPLFLRRPNLIYPRRHNWRWGLGLWQRQRKRLVGPWAWTMRLLRRVTKVRSKMPLWTYWNCKMCEWWMETWMTSLTTCSGQDIGAEFTLNKKKSGLYPFQALILPVSLRFKYHFEGTRQTNRIDKVITSVSCGFFCCSDIRSAWVVFYSCSQRRPRAPSIYGNGCSTSVVFVGIQTGTCMGKPTSPTFPGYFFSWASIT